MAGRHVDKVGSRPIVAGAAILLAIVGVYLGAQLTTEPQFLALWLPTGAVSGFAMGAISVGATSAAAGSLPPDKFAAGAGLNMTARQLGGAFGVALMASILSSSTGLDGYRAVFYFAAGASVLSAVAALGLRGSVTARAPGGAGAPAGPAPEGAR
jgi:MFS family permease